MHHVLSPTHKLQWSHMGTKGAQRQCHCTEVSKLCGLPFIPSFPKWTVSTYCMPDTILGTYSEQHTQAQGLGSVRTRSAPLLQTAVH